MKKFVSMLLPLCLSLLLFSAVAFAAEAPSLPGGTLTADVVSFASKQTYAVYAAPDSKGIRGANGRARVSTNDWIQVSAQTVTGCWFSTPSPIRTSESAISTKRRCPKMRKFPNCA